MKRKNAYKITVQPISIGRRSKKSRGREVSNMGRPHKQNKRKTQMFVDSEREGDVTPYQHQQKDNVDNLIICLLLLRLTGPTQKSID